MQNESKEICINNSSSLFDLWNKRLLHISSSSPSYELYSKKTIFVPFLNNKKVAGLIESLLLLSLLCRAETDGKTYNANVRMYFSQCYVIENRSEGTLHIDAWTYRCIGSSCMQCSLLLRECVFDGYSGCGVTLRLEVSLLSFADRRMVLNETLFFVISVIAFFVQCTSFITYIPVFFEYAFDFHSIETSSRNECDSGGTSLFERLHDHRRNLHNRHLFAPPPTGTKLLPLFPP